MKSILDIGGNLEGIQRLIEIVAGHFGATGWLMNSMDSKFHRIASYSGSPRGGVRGIWCPECHRFRFHSRVICPLCALEGKTVYLVSGCRDDGCYGNHNYRRGKNGDEESLSTKMKWVCDGLDRHSENEVITSTPLDLIYLLCANGKRDVFQNSTRTDMFLQLRYAIQNDKTFYLTSAGMACIYKSLNEDSLYDLCFENLKKELNDDHAAGCLNALLIQFSGQYSIESSLFGLSMNTY